MITLYCIKKFAKKLEVKYAHQKKRKKRNEMKREDKKEKKNNVMTKV